MLYWPRIENPHVLTNQQYSHVVYLFHSTNSLTQYHSLAGAYAGQTVQMMLFRNLVTELNILRYGYHSLRHRMFGNVIHENQAISKNMIDSFDSMFGDVKKCRDIFQHFEKYIFGDVQTARIRQSEFNRIEVPIIVNGGSRVSQFQSCLVGDQFCASDRGGKIFRVYLGADFVNRLLGILQQLCLQVSKKGPLKLRLDITNNHNSFEECVRNQRTLTIKDDDKISFIQCLFSKKSEMSDS